ncbi:MAG: hypothetical protein IKJ37_11880, partial [Kiritimatiellae bacterium]|nr:hypothetical protein [Kiritimatiellia bacterium]
QIAAWREMCMHCWNVAQKDTSLRYSVNTRMTHEAAFNRYRTNSKRSASTPWRHSAAQSTPPKASNATTAGSSSTNIATGRKCGSGMLL